VFEVGDREIALFRVGDCVHALNNFCPHQGAALAEGTVTEFQVACPWHGWRFDLRNGDCATIPGEQAITYPVRVTGGRVEVQLPAGNDSLRLDRTLSNTVRPIRTTEP
jgi:nitrite reductase (NADH) small subunit